MATAEQTIRVRNILFVEISWQCWPTHTPSTILCVQ